MLASEVTRRLAAVDGLVTVDGDPEIRERWEAARGGVLLRVAPHLGLHALDGAPARARFVALNYRLESGCPPEGPEVKAAVSALLAEAPRPLPPRMVGLALWAGSSPEESGLSSLPDAERGLALGRAFAGGVPAAWGEALELIAAWTAGVPADLARLDLLKSRAEAPLDAATHLALGIASPDVRLRALFELAVRTGTPGEWAAVWAREATRARAEVRDEPVPDTADALVAGVLAGPEPEAASESLARCLRHLPRDEHPEARAARLRVACLAAARLGAVPWSELLTLVAQDAMLKRAPSVRAQLVAEVAGGVAWLRAPGEARSAVLTHLADLGHKAQRPLVEAVVLAEVARAAARTPGRSALPWFGEIAKRLGTAADDAWASALVPRIARILAEVDLDAARGPGERLTSPYLRALWSLVLLEREATAAEVASGE